MGFIYMVKVIAYFDEKIKEQNYHGAFKNYRSASEWLISEGYEAFYDDELSEHNEEETVSFILTDKSREIIHIASIEQYTVH